uniref:Ubiquitin-like protein 4A n=1 Tax=Schistocephalus solidus TaxID=70667 RepID=A0A0X3NRV7_SCHSO
MEITVKPLGLPAKYIKVSELTTISELLPRVATEYAVDCDTITLLFKGTPLSDKAKTLQEFSIKHGDRVTVVVKPRHQTPVDFETVLNSYLLKNYDRSAAQAIASKFMQLLIKKLDSLSLDDIDRLAVVLSQQSS